MSNLQKQFEECVNLVKTGSWGDKVPYQRKLKLYGLYKSITVGQNNTAALVGPTRSTSKMGCLESSRKNF